MRAGVVVRMLGIVVGLLAGLAGCSNFEELERDECGNGIVEQGEDCDGDDPRCVSCGIRCEPDGTCAYPGAGGFVCGADDFCHAPAGTFGVSMELGAAVETFRVTDVDDDGIGDILVQSPTALQVFGGSFDGAPQLASSTLTPIARGPASYAYLDEDSDSLDVLLPTADGIAAYTSAYGVPSPHPFPSLVGHLGRPRYSHEVVDKVMAFVGTLASDPMQNLQLILLQVDKPELLPIGLGVCGSATPVSDFDPDYVDVFTIAPGYQLVAMTLGAATATPRLCVMSIRVEPSKLELGVVIETSLLRTRARPILAPLRGSCPSVIAAAFDGATPQEVVELPPAGDPIAGCTFTAVREQLEVGSGALPVGWIRIDATKSAVVLSSGVFLYAGGADPTLLAPPLYASDRRLHAAKAVDLDRDGDLDIVATSSDQDGLAEDIDVLYRTPAAFLRFRLDTAGPVSLFETGDFDGNGRTDLAFVQQRDQAGKESQELAIAYGTADQLLAPVGHVSFADVISLVVTNFPDSSDVGNLVSDMAVLYGRGTGPSITLLHGSPQRTLGGFFDPRFVEDPDRRESVFRGVVGGHFRNATGRPGLDLLAIEAVTVAGDASTNLTSEPRSELWVSDGATGGASDRISSAVLPLLARCDAASSEAAAFCVVNAQYVAVPMLPAGAPDRVIGVSVAGRGITFDAPAAGVTEATGTPWDDIATLNPQGLRLRSLELVQLSAGPRLVAAFERARGEAAGLVVACSLTAVGLPLECVDLATTIGSPAADTVCFDAAPARVTPHERFSSTSAPAVELVVLCHVGTSDVIYHLTASTNAYQATVLLAVGAASELRTGDINGDGLDDLLTVDRSGAIPTLRIYPQCTSRNRNCSGGRP
ncbi:MAG: VCBS repeat-containing protein [Deltaproteobacteria bacterium]|nr:VCBS repeat-containing protein [Deltaproteobacteria bacterium]